jgi:hypothetical protein
MSRPAFHLAQANVAYALAPHDSSLMAEYTARLDEMHELAVRSPGFVWRYLTDTRDPLRREFADPNVLFNMSVWESIDALHHYTYRARRRWFAPESSVVGGHALAMWWVSAGERPSAADARERLSVVASIGPTARAFTFKKRFPPPQSPLSPR